jgi:hypothetical protein
MMPIQITSIFNWIIFSFLILLLWIFPLRVFRIPLEDCNSKIILIILIMKKIILLPILKHLRLVFMNLNLLEKYIQVKFNVNLLLLYKIRFLFNKFKRFNLN